MDVFEKTERPSPPRPTARKAAPVNRHYEDQAKEVLREAMRKRGVTIDQLTERLRHIGIDMSAGGVANKISRGGFSAAFLLQCMDALDVDLKATTR